MDVLDGYRKDGNFNMGHKIFVSYKYADDNVYNILGYRCWKTCTVRDYVDEIEKALDKTDDIYKGESDGEDLSQLSDGTIWEKLKNRIYDSTITIVMLSKGMKEPFTAEKYQWIPQEISYSLKETPRKNKNGDNVTSHTNALLAVVIPDRNGDYSYFTGTRNCCSNGCTYYNQESSLIFDIMRGNLFNQKQPDRSICDKYSTVYHGDCHYMLCVKWEDFQNDMNVYIEKALDIQKRKEEYDIRKTI